MNTVRVGIIGVGNIGTAHADCIFSGKIHNMKLTALCDANDKRLNSLKESFTGVNLYRDYMQMFSKEKLDAVIISTPHKYHADIAMAALNAGLHILVEKPVDITITKAKQLNDAAKKSNKIFSVMFNQRTNPLFIRAKEIVKSGQLGELKRTNWIVTNWYRTQRYYDSGDWRATWSGEGGGVLINQAPHNLDLWQWICGMPSEIVSFCDIGKYHNIQVEDDVTFFARYENGATGSFITTTGEYPGTNRLEISGDQGKIVIENGELKWWKLSENEREYCFGEYLDSSNLSYEYYGIAQNNSGTGHAGIIQNFTDVILNGGELISPGYEAINELTLSNAVYLSQWKGNEVIKLPFDSDEFDYLLNEKIKNSQKKSSKSTPNNTYTYLNRWTTNW